MKTVLEQLMELKDKISAIEIAVCGETICGDGACGCGCDESPVDVVDKGSETDQGTPPEKSEEVKQLETAKAKLEAEIAGLEGTKNSVLEDLWMFS